MCVCVCIVIVLKINKAQRQSSARERDGWEEVVLWHVFVVCHNCDAYFSFQPFVIIS